MEFHPSGAVMALVLLANGPDASALQGPPPPEFFGYWDDPTPPTGANSVELYVSATRGNDSFPGTVDLPKRTITNTLSFLPAPLPTRVTINVGPGVYDAAVGELFPIDIPAHGLCLEFWPEYAQCDPPGVADPETAVLVGQRTSNVILVGSVGNQDLPGSVVRGLTINGGATGIVVEPSAAGPMAPVKTVAVELRQNVIFDCFEAIRVLTLEGWVASHVVEQNVLGLEDGQDRFFGYVEECLGTSSTLFRANRVQNFEMNVSVTNTTGDCKPRLFSNFIQLGEINVELVNCESEVRNNTIAYALEHSNVDTVNGLIWSGAIELHNNILWNPLAGSGALTAADVTPAPPIGASTNWNEDLTAVIPDFVGFGPGDLHPGVFVADDLHLSATSPLIGAGTVAEVAALGQPTAPFLEAAVGALQVRVDVNADVDMQPRLSQTAGEPALTVDIGADEVNVSTISMVAPPGGTTPFSQSPTGDLVAIAGTGTTRDFSMDLFFTGPAGGSWSLFLAYGFDDEVVHPTTGNTLSNGPILQHTQLGVGSVLFDARPGYSNLVVSGAFDGAGTSALIGLPLTGIALDGLESELYFQLLSVDALGRAELSSRQYIELNDGGVCPQPTAP